MVWSSEAFGINDRRDVVGSAQGHGVDYTGFHVGLPKGTPQHLFWGYFGVALSVNQRGVAVGWGADEIVGSDAYARMADGRTVGLLGLDPHGGSAAYDVNQRGTAAGYAERVILDEFGQWDTVERRAVLWQLR